MKTERVLIEKLKHGYSEWSELIEDSFSKEEFDLIISALEKQMDKEEMPVMPEAKEISIRLLYKSLPCINNGIQDEQLAEDIREFLLSIPDRNISSWYCPSCKLFIDPIDVTFEETHDIRSGGCGHDVKSTKISPVRVESKTIQPIDIENYLTGKDKRLYDEMGWTGEFRVSAKDILDMLIHFNKPKQ